MGKLRQPVVKKKLVALIVGVLVLLLNDVFELGIERETIVWLVGLVVSYMLGQGLADIGKERAIVQARAGTAEHLDVDINVESE